MGVQPADPPVSPMVAGAAIFGAPTVLVLAFDRGVSDHYGCFDGGLFTMAVCLAAESRGLGTCVTTSNVRYPDLLRKILPGDRETEDAGPRSPSAIRTTTRRSTGSRGPASRWMSS